MKIKKWIYRFQRLAIVIIFTLVLYRFSIISNPYYKDSLSSDIGSLSSDSLASDSQNEAPLDPETKLNMLYNRVAYELLMHPSYVRILHEISGNNGEYDDSLADTLYSTASEINRLMRERRIYNTEVLKDYYEALSPDVRDNIDFDEAVLKHVGVSDSAVNGFYNAYEKVLSEKGQKEPVVEGVSEDLIIREKFISTFNEIGIVDKDQLHSLAILLSHDEKLYENDNIEKLENLYAIPYEIGLTSRENMMTAAMSLVGRVRYVWGGGHSGASYIKGINPVWRHWDELYPSEPVTQVSSNRRIRTRNGISDNVVWETKENVGFGTCIKPSRSWCPIHGYSNASFHGETIYSLDDYINIRKNLFSKIDLTDEKYREMLSTVDYTGGINAHVLDGLDCSGYASWLFNQITNKYKVNTAARFFTGQPCFRELEMGEELLPGDIFSWQSHIVIIVGPVRKGSGAYVTIEETPNVLKFGVGYYSDANKKDIADARLIAAEANSLIGGLNQAYEVPHMYCINTVGISQVTESYGGGSGNGPEALDSESDNTASNGGGSRSQKRRGEGYKENEYYSVIDGVRYKIIRAYMPRGYTGNPANLGIPADGTYDFKEVVETDQGFYGTYYVALDEEEDHELDYNQDSEDSTGGGDTGQPSESGNSVPGEAPEGTGEGNPPGAPENAEQGNESTDSGDGENPENGNEGGEGESEYIIIRIFMPRDYTGSPADLGIPPEGTYEYKEVVETDEGFYGTYYIRRNKPQAKLEDYNGDSGAVENAVAFTYNNIITPINNNDSDVHAVYLSAVDNGDTPEIESNKPKTVNTMKLARFIDPFIDENEPLDDTGKPLKDMSAYEIISHTITTLPISYIQGYNTYDGVLWPSIGMTYNLNISE